MHNNGYLFESTDDRSHYNLYQSDMNAATWKKIGSYSLGASAGSKCRFFMSDGMLYFYDSQGNRYQIEL